METQKNANNKTAQKDVHTIANDKIIEYLKKGIVPWRKNWTTAGVPTSLISRNPFRGINVMLLGVLGYERNLFLTEKQLKHIDGAVKAGERPNLAVYWNRPKDDGEATEPGGDRKESKLRYYHVYNISQCVGISWEMAESAELHPTEACAEILDRMPHKPVIKYKEATAYYDPIDDILNMPKKTSFKNEAYFFVALVHQIVHSTGHHTRLDRMGLVQMPEFGCEPFTLEELVAEIATNYLLSYVGIQTDFVPAPEYLQGWIEKLSADKYLIFTAATLAQKAVDFIFDINDAEDAELAREDVEEHMVS